MGAVVSKVSGRSAFRPVFGLYPCGRFTTPVAVTEEVFLPLRSCNKACIPGSLTRGGHSGSPYPGWRVQCAAVSYLAGTPGRLARGGHSVCPCPRLAGAVGEGVLPRRHLGSSYPGWPVWVSLPRVGRCKGMRSSYLSSVCVKWWLGAESSLKYILTPGLLTSDSENPAPVTRIHLPRPRLNAVTPRPRTRPARPAPTPTPPLPFSPRLESKGGLALPLAFASQVFGD